MKLVAIIALLSLLSACGPRADEQTPAESTALVMTEVRSGAPLDEMLALLEADVIQADSGGMEGAAVNHFRRAEAISDRLLEARLPFQWITSERYSLQARLRQIQSSADRVLAQAETGAPREQMLRDLRQLRLDIRRLREAIAQGGGRAPTPLEVLMTDSAERRPVPRTTATPQSTTDTAAVRPTTTGG